MRKIFFAAAITQKTRKPFLSYFHTLEYAHPSLSFSTPGKWHITLHYVGSVTEKAYEAIRENFSRVELPPVSPVILGGTPALGTFGNAVLFLRVRDTGTGLAEVHHTLKEMVPVHETRKYAPHVSWARNPKHADLGKIARENSFTLEKECILGHVILFESRSSGGKTIYTPLARRALRQR